MPHISERERLLTDFDRVSRRIAMAINHYPRDSQRLREQLNEIQRLHAMLSVIINSISFQILQHSIERRYGIVRYQC